MAILFPPKMGNTLCVRNEWCEPAWHAAAPSGLSSFHHSQCNGDGSCQPRKLSGGDSSMQTFLTVLLSFLPWNPGRKVYYVQDNCTFIKHIVDTALWAELPQNKYKEYKRCFVTPSKKLLDFPNDQYKFYNCVSNSFEKSVINKLCLSECFIEITVTINLQYFLFPNLMKNILQDSGAGHKKYWYWRYQALENRKENGKEKITKIALEKNV